MNNLASVIVLGLAHSKIGPDARTNVFHVVFRVMLILRPFLVLGAQKIIRICCTPY